MNIIFNGPPSSGKNEGCGFLEVNYNFEKISFKEHLIQDTINLFGVSENWFLSGYEANKKLIPEERLRGMSRKQALVYTAEDVMKTNFGLDYYGRKTAEKLNDVSSYCFSDGGFEDEVLPVINTIGTDNICIVQLFREGCSFSNDPRKYLNGYVQDEYIINHTSIKPIQNAPTLPIRSYQIHNNGNVRDFHQIIRKIIRRERNVKGEESDCLFRESI
jgi:hypothetical protein